MSVSKLLESLPAYVHLESEKNRLYLILTRDIQAKWLAGYWTEDRYYHTVTEDTPEAALKALVSLVDPNKKGAGK